MQSFLFGVNTPSRWGSQAPFTNVTFDWTVPADLKDRKALVGGSEADFTYGDCQAEMDLVNKVFIESMIEGDAEGRGFQYPIPTYNLTEGFDWGSPNAELLFAMTAKYGTPYFQNFINSDLDPSDVRSMCCRLQLDKRELRKRGGGLFGSDELTGSIGVVTINLPRIGYLADSEDDFYARLFRLMDLAKESLVVKRKVITRLLDAGLFPYTRRYLPGFGNHFSTIGLVGMNECCLNFLGKDIATREGREFALAVLARMRERLSDYQVETGDLFNLEATPAESTSYRLAKHDRARYADIVSAGKDEPYYTNSSQLSADFTDDIFDALDHQEGLQALYTGGTVFHAFVGEAIEDWRTCRSLVEKIARGYRIPYFTISPTFSVCPNHGYVSGEHFSCPTCSAETEVYSRIVGYYRSIRNWNAGKREEYGKRKNYRFDGTAETRLPGRPIEAASPAVKDPSPDKQTGAVAGGFPDSSGLFWLLFSRSSCPNCPPVRSFVESLTLEGSVVDTDTEEGALAAVKYGVLAAPTAIFLDGSSREIFRGRTATEIAANLRTYSSSSPKSAAAG
jgi:ribonucleoside-triphosphate reductase (formate)